MWRKEAKVGPAAEARSLGMRRSSVVAKQGGSEVTAGLAVEVGSLTGTNIMIVVMSSSQLKKKNEGNTVEPQL